MGSLLSGQTSDRVTVRKWTEIMTEIMTEIFVRLSVRDSLCEEHICARHVAHITRLDCWCSVEVACGRDGASRGRGGVRDMVDVESETERGAVAVCV